MLDQDKQKTNCGRSEDIPCPDGDRFDDIFEQMTAAAALIHPDGRFQCGNPAYCRQLGYTEQELQQLHYASLLHPDDLESTLNELKRLQQGAVSGVQVSGRYRHKSGQFVCLHKCISMLSDSGGRRAHLVTVTDSGAAEGCQNRAHDRNVLERMFERLPVLLVMWDPRLERFTLNAEAERVLGWTSADANDGDFMTKVYPDPVYRADVSAYMQGLQPGWRELICTAKNGETVPIEWTNIRLGDNTLIGIGVDLRQRREAQEALRRYELLAQHSRDILLFMRLEDGRILEANAAAETAYGYSRDELLGMTIFDLRAEATRQSSPNQMQQADERGILFETVHQRRDGSTFPVEVSSRGGMIGGTRTLISIIRNISERKEAAAALAASEARFQSIAETDVIGVLYAEVETGQVLDANDEYLRIIGRTRKDLAAGSLNWKAMTPPEELKREEMLTCCCQAGERVMPFDKNYIRPDGTLVPVYIGGTVLPDDPSKAVAFVLDITERKEAEQAIAASERKYRQLVESANCAIIRWRADGTVTFFNRYAETFFGYRSGEIVGRHIGLIVPDFESTGTDLRSLVDDIVRHPDGYVQNLNENMCRDGRRVWVNWTNRAIVDQQGQVLEILAIGVDVTDRRRAEQELRELNESLEQRVAARTDEVRQQAAHLRALASQLSQAEQRERKRLAKILHDHIQQLIVAARMQMAWIKCDGDSEQQAIVQGVDSILDEALDASRSLAMDLSPPVLHEAGLIGGLNWLASRMWAKHQFSVSLKADNRAEPATEEVRFLLFECARELLFNAIKHAQVSEADVVLLRNGQALELTVSDHGRGFDPEAVNSRGTDAVSFGLFSIRERLAHIGGHMSVETAPGQGVRIRLSVPAAEFKAPTPDAVQDKPTLSEYPAAERSSKICRVLIVDDHKIMREGLSRLLQFEHDIEVVGQAADGPQAVEMACELDPDIVIMDINLGAMSGIEATRQILSKRPAAKVIGLSMHEDRNVAKAMRDAGAAAYLTKVGPSDDLIAAVRACYFG